MAKHVCSLYDLIRSNSDTNQQKNWKEVENRVKTQVPLRIMSCVQLASKLTSHYKVRGRPFDFWAGRGGYGWFQKKISCRPFERKKKSCKEITAIQWLCMSGKKFYHQRFEEKNFLHKPNHPHPLQKSNGRPVNEL